MSATTFPILHTTRLDLIETKPAHAPALFRLFTDERVTRYYTVFPFRSEADLLPVITSFRDRYAAQQGVRWAITLRGQQELIGTIGFQSYTHGHKGSLVFALAPEYQGQGLITEALEAVIKYGSETLKLNRVDAEVMPGNTASVKVLTKLSFTHEALLRQWLYWSGKHYDMNMYALFKIDHNQQGP